MVGYGLFGEADGKMNVSVSFISTFGWIGDKITYSSVAMAL